MLMLWLLAFPPGRSLQAFWLAHTIIGGRP
jgi:hypothetical protein